ncbi:MAG: response regulator [Calditrichaeota bacterium]|nr:MAG: response regulator [Calditrichota bacterium]
MSKQKLKDRSILIIDDDPSIRFLVKSALRNLKNVHFTEAGNGKEGFDLLAHKFPDLIFLDVVMPVMNGIDFLHKLRADAQYSNIPVILLTGYRDSERLVDALKLPKTTLITKPFLLEDLVEQAQKYLSTNQSNLTRT